jgi:hypothetical protein
MEVLRAAVLFSCFGLGPLTFSVSERQKDKFVLAL